MINKLTCIDCLKGMKKLPSNNIDTIITDPPYGLKFMGKKWDYKIPSVEHFKEMLRVAKPGATLLCFGGTRTFHRIAVNIEDAGWEIVDTLMWLYGSGFPKAQDISKMIDKKAGVEREVIGIDKTKQRPNAKDNRAKENAVGKFGVLCDGGVITKPTTDNAKLWNGWKSHALKPAFEPIIMARKRNDGTYVNNALVHGVAGLNIDGSRIGTEGARFNGRKVDSDIYGKYGVLKPKENYHKGRYPANVILDEEAGRLLDKQSGVLTSGGGDKGRVNFKGFNGILKDGLKPIRGNIAIKNVGGTSRFFYCAKASKSERNKGCEGLKLKQTTGGGGMNNTEDDVCGKYGSIKAKANNHHPTVKPLKLMEYLCNLTKTPTGGIVLDPYAGSGSTLIAAKKVGRDFIGFELNNEYVKIAQARLKSVEPLLKEFLK